MAREEMDAVTTKTVDDALDAAQRDEILAGLTRRPKNVASKYLYDRRGSELFEEICELPEYYPTRTETALLADRAGEIARLIGPDAEVVEFGSGASTKIRLLLSALKRPAGYIPIDISGEHLHLSVAPLREDFPDLTIAPVVGDFTETLGLPEPAGAGMRVGFFPGSTIGNFTPAAARDFLASAGETLGRDAGFLVGVDLKKDLAILHAAYNDEAGVTAAFNLNLLARLNREADADFDLEQFSHKAVYNETLGRIEMHLVGHAEQTVTVAGRQIRFAEGETIHTESSYKYELDQFADLARRSGWRPVAAWTDPRRLFSLHFLRW
jgi:dimethylhistidine N-methyltransferase